MRKVILILSIITAAFSCTNKLLVFDNNFVENKMPYLKDNEITREELILKLGEPSWIFENGRIFTYRLSIDKNGNVLPVRIINNKNDPNFSYAYAIGMRYYSLVLIFSPNNVLQKHSLLLTNP